MHSQIGKENVKSSKAKAEMYTADLYVFNFCFEKELILISCVISISRTKKNTFVTDAEAASIFKEKL